MLTDPIEDVTFDDIRALVDTGEAERDDLDYKAELPEWTKKGEGKKEFLKDVCAMANGRGGWLVYGVTELKDEDGKTTGMPDGIVGIEYANEDQEKRRLRDIVRNGIAPRIDSKVAAVTESGDETRRVLLLRVMPAPRPPCMVTFSSDSRFWVRHGAGRVAMDVDEIRRAMVEAEAWLERLADLRLARIKAIKITVPLVCGPQSGFLAMHVAPLRAMGSGQRINVIPVCREHPPKLISLVAAQMKPNLDGFLAESPLVNGIVTSWVQVYRNGVIETVDLVDFKGRGHTDPAESVISEFELFNNLARILRDQLSLLLELGFAGPFVVMLTLKLVGQWHLAHSDIRGGTFDRGNILLPDVLVDGLDGLQTALDEVRLTLWQAAGWDEPPA